MHTFTYKLVLLYTLILSCGMVSCSRNEDIVVAPILQPISIHLNIESNTTASSPTKIGILDSDLQNMEYFIYAKENDVLVKSQKVKRQSSDDKKFATINETLPVGEYYIVVIASSQNMLHIEGDNYSDTQLLMASSQSKIYSNTIELSVVKDIEPQQITLAAIVSKVEIEIQDAALIPNGVTAIQAYMHNSTPAAFSFKKHKSRNVPNGGDGSSHSYIPIGATIQREDILHIDATNPITFFMLPNTQWDALNNDLYMSLVFENGVQEVKLLHKSLPINLNETTRIKGILFGKDVENLTDLHQYWTVATTNSL